MTEEDIYKSKARYEKILMQYFVVVFIIGLISFNWAIAKGFMLNWNIFNFELMSLNVLIGLTIPVFLMYYCSKHVLIQLKGKKIEHEFDERIVGIFSNSFRNLGISMLLLLFIISMIFSLFFGYTEVIFSLKHLGNLFWFGVIVYFGFYLYCVRK